MFQVFPNLERKLPPVHPSSFEVVRLLSGAVRYREQPAGASIDPGFCLTCVAQPDAEQVVLDA